MAKPNKPFDDERFAHAASDPKFKRMRQNATKVKVDPRFKEVLTSSDFALGAQRDSRGEALYDNKAKDHFILDEQDEEAIKEKQAYHDAVARGDIQLSSSSESEDSDEEEVDEAFQQEEEIKYIPTGEETNRIAIVNMDWNHLTATDIFVTLQSFVGSGSLNDVTIYLSNYGKEKMAEEAALGPQGIWKEEDGNQDSQKKNNDSESESEISESEISEDEIHATQHDLNANEEGYDPLKLRQYELQRMRYFFAIATFDSVKTANGVYEQCDGSEFELSSNVFDLRFVPEEEKFDHEVRDTCTSMPLDYEPKAFYTQALQSTNVGLTWDEGEENRRTLRGWQGKNLTDRDLDRFNAFVASDDEDDDEVKDEKKKKELEKRLKKTRKELLGESDSESDSDADSEDVDEIDGAMEMTFNPDVGKTGQAAKAEKEERENETLFEARMRRRQERKSKQKRAHKDEIKKRIEEAKEAKLNPKKREKLSAEDSKRQKAELQLLTMTENVEKMNDNMGSISSDDEDEKPKKLSRKQKMKLKKKDDGFKIDASDDRFGAVMNNPDFSIDPTHKDFKKTAAMETFLDEKTKKSKRSKKNLSRTKVNEDEPQNQGPSVESLINKFKRSAPTESISEEPPAKKSGKIKRVKKKTKKSKK